MFHRDILSERNKNRVRKTKNKRGKFSQTFNENNYILINPTKLPFWWSIILSFTQISLCVFLDSLFDYFLKQKVSLNFLEKKSYVLCGSNMYKNV